MDRDKLSKKTKAEILDAMDQSEKDGFRRLRLQAKSIDHLMRGRGYEEEMQSLHVRLADAERRLEEALSELRKLRGENDSAFNLPVGEAV